MFTIFHCENDALIRSCICVYVQAPTERILRVHTTTIIDSNVLEQELPRTFRRKQLNAFENKVQKATNEVPLMKKVDRRSGIGVETVRMKGVSFAIAEEPVKLVRV